MEDTLKKGYNIIFLIKKDCVVEELNYMKIKKDMSTLFTNLKLIVMEK